MKVQDLFQYNPQTHTIARIPHADMDNRFKRAANKIYRGVEASKLFLSYFFGKHCIPDASRPQQIDTSIDEDPPQLSFTPFVDCLRFTLPSTKSFTDVTTKNISQNLQPTQHCTEILDRYSSSALVGLLESSSYCNTTKCYLSAYQQKNTA